MSEEQSPRHRILHAVSDLMEMHGYHATGLNDIVRSSGAPKGSLYHYFPDGKEEMAAETIQARGHMVAEHIRSQLAAIDDPAEAIYKMMSDMAAHMQQHQCKRGAPIASVALEMSGSSERIREACEAAYSSWQEIFKAKLVMSGIPTSEADALALHIVTAIEGVMVISRTRQTSEPILQSATILRDLIRSQITPHT